MTDSIADIVARARELIEAGDQGEAQALLARCLTGAEPALTAPEAVALAEATGLLITLDAGLVPAGVLDDHVARMRVLTSGVDAPEVEEARAAAALQAVEWIHDEYEDDPLILVDVLRAAERFAEESAGDGRPPGVRRARAEALLTAQLIRGRLNQDPASIASELESLAVLLTGESDDRMRHIRVHALLTATRERVRHGLFTDAAEAEALLRRVIAESAGLPAANHYRYDAMLLLVDHAAAEGTTSGAVLAEAFELAALTPAPLGPGAVHAQARFLGALLERVPGDGRDAAAIRHWGALIDGYARHPDPEIRERAAREAYDAARADAADVGPAGLRILEHAARSFADDEHPATREQRLRIAALIAQVYGVPDLGARGAAGAGAPPAPAGIRDVARSIALYERIEDRFAGSESDERLAPAAAAAMLDHALRLVDAGRRRDAISVIGRMQHRFAASTERVRHLLAQADFWRTRLLREDGDRAAASALVDRTVAAYAADPDPDVRMWAANALLSAWKAEAASDAEIEAAMSRFASLFGEDRDPRIRRHDASRLLFQGVRAHGRGDRVAARAAFIGLTGRYDADTGTDAEIADIVRLARENLTILGLSSTAPPSTEVEARYRQLRDRLYRADELLAAGSRAAALQSWREIAEETANATDPQVAVIGLAALDQLGGELADDGQWEQLAEVAQRATIIPPDLDTRADRIRARAHLRLGIALNRLGNPRAAIAAYEALDRFAAGISEEEVTNIRLSAVYNRAVLIDDLGDAQGAIAAYDYVVAVHRTPIGTPARRLRQVKALRNKARLLDGLGRVPEAAGAHRQILDVAAAAPDAELAERARASAFDLAACFARMGDHRSAAQGYAWIVSARGLGFSRPELKAAAQAEKQAAKMAKKTGR